MEPRIPNGSFCLFADNVAGSRQAKILLVQHRDISDPENGGSYTVKRYVSIKEPADDSWRHTEIPLEPLNPSFESIVLKDVMEDDVRVIAEVVDVLG